MVEKAGGEDRLTKKAAIHNLGVVTSTVCMLFSLCLNRLVALDNYIKTQEEMNRAGLAEPSCTGEVVNKQQNSPHEVIFPAGQTYTTIEVPESQTVTMTLGEGCRPGTPGREAKVGVRDDLWEKVKPGDMLYHPGGSADWDVYDNYPVPMVDSTGSKENNPMDNNDDDSEPAASEFYISPQALEEIASN